MQRLGPFAYEITFTPKKVTKRNFTKPVNESGPKLYVVSKAGKPIFVGAAKKGTRDRLYQGFRNRYTYAWRRKFSSANLAVWLQDGGDLDDLTFIETVEAEVVFLIRQLYGQWPEHQTEIHFHSSDDKHRQLAQRIVDYYRMDSCPTA